MQKWQCRVAPSLGELEGEHNDVWGTLKYKSIYVPTVFMGLYSFRDFIELWNHRGRKAILWCGSDIVHFKNGYWLDENGNIRLDFQALAKWINESCYSFVENVVEHEELRKLGISSTIVPSFMGDVKKYKVSYKHSLRPKLYASVSGDNFKMYGWDRIDELAKQHPNVEFHLYGNTKPWKSPHKNVYVHGRISKEKMNEQIQKMQGGLRLLEHDGFSEILAKSILWGQWPVSAIPYPHMLSIDEIGTIKDKKEANIEGRDYYLREVNRFPWNDTFNE